MKQIKLKIGKYRNAFGIPDGVKEVTVKHEGNRIVVEMVPDKTPEPGDVMINKQGKVYILRAAGSNNVHRAFAWLDKSGRLVIRGACYPGRLATPEEAQPLFDALKKEWKRWNPKTMQVEDVPEIYRIREWVEKHLKAAHYNHDHISMAIDSYLKYREVEK